jgi:SNF2 family DNA or RNA helicase
MNFSHQKTARSVEISATFEDGHFIPPSEWMMHASGPILPAVASLKALADSGEAETSDQGFILDYARLVQLPEHEAMALNLHARAPYSLQVQHKGVISEPQFRILWNLRQRSGSQVVVSERQGCFIRVGGMWYRLSATQFHLIEACDRISASMATNDMDERLRAYSELASYLPESPDQGVTTSPLLKQFQVFDAGAFSLRPRIENGKLIFDPVLYARKFAQSEVDSFDEENEPVPLLPEAANKDFVEILKENASRYSLGGNRYVVLSPHLQMAMNTVKRLSHSKDAEAQRRLFLEPAKVLRDEFASDLGEEKLDEILGSLFLETKEYLAGRIIGIGIWKKPVLPWIKRRGNDWFPPDDDNQPPAAGVRLETINGPVDIPLRKLEAKELLAKLQKAREMGDDYLTYKGHRLPVSEATELAVSVVNDPPKNVRPPQDPDAKLAILVEGNYETLGYMSNPDSRRPTEGFCIPSQLKTNLKRHQLDGLQWLQESWAAGVPGLLLADDMGLGKTLQALSFLVWLNDNCPRTQEYSGGFLIVAPTSLLRNWKAEHEMHFSQPALGDPLQIHGAQAARIRDGNFKELDTDILRRADWVLTTYETLTKFQKSFAQVGFRCIIFDEAQKIKTPGTQVRDSALALRADFKIAMTGTPVENRRADFWCISDAVYPGLLGSLKDFSETFEKEESSDTARGLNDFITTGHSPVELSQLFRPSPMPFMKRRMKESVLDGLPIKTLQAEPIEMPTPQAVRYREILVSALGNTKSGAKLEAIQNLRLASLHPWLTEKKVQDTALITKTANNLDEFILSSARIISLVRILDDIRLRNDGAGEKALIFVNSRKMQDHLLVLFKEKYNLSHVALINGATPEAKRQKAVDDFQESELGFELILLSPKAAGVGFTLTAANHVIHLDRWWNPAVEDQCTDRAYRIGQKKPVTIWIPQAIHPDSDLKDHSFDLRLHDLLEYKRQMSRDLLAPTENREKDTDKLFNEVVSCN